MSNIKGLEVSVKEYAESRGKTVQAVYQQMKRKENAMALDGHIIIRRIGNKDVKFLDEKAVAILDEGSQSTPTIIIQTNTEEKLAEVNKILEALKYEYKKLEGRNELLQEQLAEKDKRLLMLEGRENKIEALEAQNGVLRADNDKKDELLAEANKTAQELAEELTEEKERRISFREYWQRRK